MKKIDFEMSGFVFSGYVPDNSFFTEDIGAFFDEIIDVYYNQEDDCYCLCYQINPSFSNDVIDGQDAAIIGLMAFSPSLTMYNSPQTEKGKAEIPFGISVTAEDGTIIKPMPDYDDIVDVYSIGIEKFKFKTEKYSGPQIIEF